MNLFEIKKQRAFPQAKAESIVAASESAHREMTQAEQQEFDMAMGAVTALDPQIARIARRNTIQQHLVEGKLIPAAGNLRQARTPNAPVVFSEDYYNDFFSWVGTRGQQMGAALYEGTGSAGGFAVPVYVEGQVVPLAPTEMGIRSIANVIPTASDIKVPRGTAFGTAALKAESGGGADNFFTETDPTLDQFTLSAFMGGAIRTISWELAQDVPSFQQFCITDLIIAMQVLEESLFIGGTGTGQAQGLIGNVGAGVTCATHAFSDILDSTFDVMGIQTCAPRC